MPNLSRTHRSRIATVGRDHRMLASSFNGILSPQDSVLLREALGNYDKFRDLQRDAKVQACLEKRYDATIAAHLIVEPGPRKGMAPTRR